MEWAASKRTHKLSSPPSLRSGLGKGAGGLGLLLLLALPGTALARPEYAAKETKACLYCHRSPTPGAANPRTGVRETTERNPRGLYYAAHNHTFQGYQELAVMGKESPPVFHLAWKEELRDLPRRALAADVVGDGTVRLVTLNEQAENKTASTLTVQKWDGKAFVTEFSAPVQASAERLAVGKFAGANRPAVIVTAAGLWYWDGKAFVSKPASGLLPVLGATRLRNGEERVLITEPGGGAKAYRVDTDAAGSGWLADGIETPASSQVAWGDMHNQPGFFTAMGLANDIASGGLIGLWDARGFGTMFLYYARIELELVTQPDPKDPTKTIQVGKGASGYVTFRNARDVKGVELWETPKLDGIPFDIGLADPKGSGKPGLLILASDSASGKGRSLYFFALD
jgi:hypothetical protein